MKTTRKRKLALKLSPRNTGAVAPIMKKGGPHQRTDKRAPRARQTARLRRALSGEAE